ncbi:hypothetical protein [Planomonospora parontospora]|uniref:hypothetical protein n=1 Tax=Planomonospora parontospora TaxID=58119 RepID=UPI00167130AD|nr:hypothetical protein [Planomonospora parontospora]GGL11435.1 hypothetical protein GCM10014719_11630 [Planomonospora parontospora subsp. antibiotica]GII14877.1 hypothetical protein Ppa05_16030 [Planomonospora parontospora subsp. antibiotica]
MWIVVAVVCGVLLAAVLAVLVLVAVSVRTEDGRASITGRAPGAAAAGTRRLLGMRVDHGDCRAHPRDACPLCHRLLQEETGRPDGRPPPGREEYGAPGPRRPPEPRPDEITGG